MGGRRKRAELFMEIYDDISYPEEADKYLYNKIESLLYRYSGLKREKNGNTVKCVEEFFIKRMRSKANEEISAKRMYYEIDIFISELDKLFQRHNNFKKHSFSFLEYFKLVYRNVFSLDLSEIDFSYNKSYKKKMGAKLKKTVDLLKELDDTSDSYMCKILMKDSRAAIKNCLELLIEDLEEHDKVLKNHTPRRKINEGLSNFIETAIEKYPKYFSFASKKNEQTYANDMAKALAKMEQHLDDLDPRVSIAAATQLLKFGSEFQQSLGHSETLLGEVKISNPNKNESEFRELEKKLLEKLNLRNEARAPVPVEELEWGGIISN